MKTKEILMIHCLALLGIALISSLFKKVPGIVKNGSFFIAIVLLAVSQVLDETENLELDSSSCTNSNQCKDKSGAGVNNCCFEYGNSCLGVYNKDGPNPICVCCPGSPQQYSEKPGDQYVGKISQAWNDHGDGVPIDPCWKKAIPSKYGPACGSKHCMENTTTDEKNFLFTDEELTESNLIETTPRLYGSRKDNDGNQSISWDASKISRGGGASDILQCYGVGCPTLNTTGESCEKQYPNPMGPQSAACRTRPWDGTIFSSGDYTCSLSAAGAAPFGPSYGLRSDTGKPGSQSYCPPGTIEGNQYNTSGIGGFKCGQNNRNNIKVSDSLIWDSVNSSWKKNGTSLSKNNDQIDNDNWDVICKTPCCRAQAEYCCRTIPFTSNSDDYNEFKKCLSDRGCATDFTGHPLPETTLKLMWNNCQENY